MPERSDQAIVAEGLVTRYGEVVAGHDVTSHPDEVRRAIRPGVHRS